MINLIADIGGTNIRLALSNATNIDFSAIRTYAVADFNGLEAAIEQYLEDERIAKLDHVCIAIACPVNGDKVTMTNHSWSFSISAVKKYFSLKTFSVINDFTAQAMCLPYVSEDAKIQIGGQEPDLNKPMVVYGPGTGLGVAHLIKTGNAYTAFPGEGGHVSFAPNDEIEKQILKILQKQYGHVSVERLLSGPGLYTIYKSVCEINQTKIKYTSPAEVCNAAVEKQEEFSVLTLNVFCNVMGSFGGNLALNMGTYGGVYIAGGVVPRFIDFFKNSEFRARFEAKGRFNQYLSPIPVYVVTEDQPGLLGAAAYLAQNIEV